MIDDKISHLSYLLGKLRAVVLRNEYLFSETDKEIILEIDKHIENVIYKKKDNN